MRFLEASLILVIQAGLFSGPVEALSKTTDLVLDYDTAKELAQLPLECYNKEYPYKSAIVFNSSQDVQEPKYHHPIFYGCFDWHSSAHGHWLLAALLRQFPNTSLAENITKVFDEQFTLEKAEQETVYLKADKAFERTYGWSWFLKLHQELQSLGSLDEAKNWSANLQPIADHFVASYKSFLPKLAYPVRVGEHTNTAFGLIFAFEYAKYTKDEELESVIVNNVTSQYGSDEACPLSWEPSGYDFLSPCLQEADLVSRIAAEDRFPDFKAWFQKFLPQFQNETFKLEPGIVNDRTDGKLVHLDGLNFSRAYNLYSIIINYKSTAKDEDKFKSRLMKMADDHIRQSIDYVVGSDYAGSHWLASFLTYALQKRGEALKHLHV